MANYPKFSSIKQQPFYYAHDNLGLHEETQMAEARTAGDGRSTFKIASFTYDFLIAWWPQGS